MYAARSWASACVVYIMLFRCKNERGDYMTHKELSQLYWLKSEIAYDKRRLAKLRTTTSESDTTELEAVIAANIERCTTELTRLEQYIAAIPDDFTRQIFTLRYVRSLSWLKVALQLGGNNNSDNVKQICYRYLKKN